MEAALNQHGTLPTSCVWKMEKLMSVILIFYQRKVSPAANIIDTTVVITS